MKYGLEEVIKVLDNAPFRWLVAGGHGLDLFIGHKTREHSDVDIVVFRKDAVAVFDFLGSYELQIVTNPGQLLPHSKASDLIENRHTVWVKDRKTNDDLLELLFNDSDENNWLYRRNKNITLPLSRVGIDIGKLQVLAPEIVLLYKSKEPRNRDEQDFKNALPSIRSEAKAWLREAIQTDYPKHPWSRKL